MAMLSISRGEPETLRRKSCPAYHIASTNVIMASRPSTPTPIRSCSTTERLPPTTLRETDQSKVQVHKKLHRFEDELKRAFSKVRNAGSHIKEKISPQKDGDDEKPIFPNPLERTLNVIYASAPNKKKHTSLDDLIEADQAGYVNDEVNANPALTLESLANSCFSASIALNKFPPAGDIIIRISGYKLDFYWMAHRPKNAGKRSNHVYNQKPIYCNGVDLPMYVDPQHLNFNLVHDSLISVIGQTKGFMSRRKSISTEDLSIDKFFRKSPRIKKKERFRKHSPAMLFDSLNELSRDRAYTS